MEAHINRCKEDEDMTGSSVTDCKGQLERIGIKESQPRHAHRKRAIGRGGWLGWESWSLNQIHTLQRPRALPTGHVVGKDCCAEPTLMLPETPPWASSCIRSSRENEKLHFCFRAMGIEWEVKPRHWAGRTSGDELSSRSFKFFRGTELIKRAFLWHPYSWRQEKRMLISRNPVAAPKRTGNNERSERKHRQTHGLQPESGNIQSMATAVNPMQGRVDLKQPMFPGWRSNPHTWWPSPFIPLKWPHVNRGCWNLFMPVTSLWRVPEGLVGLSDSSGRRLLAARQPQSPEAGHGGEVRIVTALGEWLNLFGKLARRQRNWKGNVVNSFGALTFPHKR